MTTDPSVRTARRMLHDIVRYAALLDERAAAAAAPVWNKNWPTNNRLWHRRKTN